MGYVLIKFVWLVFMETNIIRVVATTGDKDLTRFQLSTPVYLYIHIFLMAYHANSFTRIWLTRFIKEKKKKIEIKIKK